MKTIFVDSNVFLRFLADDDVEQHRKAVNLFRKARDGKILLVTGPPVLFEIAWTLRTVYNTPREQVLDFLRSLLSIKGLTLIDAGLVVDALDLALTTSHDFADAYIAASASRSGAHAIATFNRRHFEKLGVVLHPL